MTNKREYTEDGLPVISEKTREALRDYIFEQYKRGLPKDRLSGSLIEKMVLSGNGQITEFMQDMISEFEENNPDLEGDYLAGHADGFAYGVVLIYELFKRQAESNKFEEQFRLD